MDLKIPYDGCCVTINIPLPDQNITVLQGKDPAPAKDVSTLTQEALSAPIGKKKLSEIVSPGKKVALLFDDFTRLTPVSTMMPFVLDELKRGGIRNEDVTLVCANGMHNPEYMNQEKLRERVGSDVFSNYKVISHNAYEFNELKFIGITEQLGTPLFVNRFVAAADIKVTIGRIAPHGDMGYSGGAKMIMAGVSGIWSIIHNHTGSYPRRGVLKNPLRDDADECARMAGLDFIVNVVYNSKGEPLQVFAGDPFEARLKGIEYGDQHVWGAKIPHLADIVIMAPGIGKDDYFMSSMGGLGIASNCLKEDGTIVVVASCKKGWSTEEYLESGWHVSKDLLNYDYPHLMWLLASRAWQEPHLQYQALVYYVNHIAKTCHDYEVVLAGAKGISRDEAQKLNMRCIQSIEKGLDYAIRKQGKKAKIIVIPDTYTLPLEQYHTCC
ncbi:MAG TPA: nickel-dependent lactate racemase [Syntrophales bacterium]|nr:nickel-dependent lactate racemase [Syntrophales bacterium]